MSKIYTKYKFRGLPLLVLGDNNKFYRLPFDKDLRYYNLKELTPKEHKGVSKLLYMNKRYTKSKLNSLKEEFRILIKEDSEGSDSLNTLLSQLENVDIKKIPTTFLM